MTTTTHDDTLPQSLAERIEERLQNIETLTLIASKEVYTIQEASIFTGYSEQSLYLMTCKREIPHYKKRRKVYFKKNELQEWMLGTRVKDNSSLELKGKSRYNLEMRGR